LTPQDPHPYDPKVSTTRRTATELIRRPRVQATGLYLLLALVVTYPLCTGLASLQPGEHFDAWGAMWLGHWYQQAVVVDHVSPFFCPELGYPFGLSQLLTDSWIWALCSIPLVTLLGPPLALNTFVIGSLVFSGVALYALVRDRGASHLASLLAGTLYLSSSLGFALFAEGAVYLLMSGWLPLIAMFLLRILEGSAGPRVHWALALSFCGACYTSGYCGASAVVVAATVLAARPTPPWRAPYRGTVLRTGLIAAVVLLPLVLANASALRGEATSSDAFAGDTAQRVTRSRAEWLPAVPRDSATLTSLFTPPAVTRTDNPNPRERTSYLGIIPLVLTVLGWRAMGRGRRRRLWIALFAVALLLVLGPVLLWSAPPFGQAAPSFPPLPLKWVYEWLPFTGVLRFPYRFLHVVLLAMAVPMALGLDGVLARLSRRGRIILVGALLAEVLLVAGGPPIKPVQSVDVSPAYDAIVEAGGEGAVLELGNVGQAWRNRRVFAQTLHGRPITSEFPMYGQVSTSSLFHALIAQRMDYELSGGREGVSPETFVSLLQRLGFDFVIHDHHSIEVDGALDGPVKAQWLIGASTVLQADLGGGRTFEPGMTVYRVPGGETAKPALLPTPSELQRQRMTHGQIAPVLDELLRGWGDHGD